eukprot:247134_1
MEYKFKSKLNKIRENADLQEKVVLGYLRKIEHILDQDLIIPTEIYMLCYQFYWSAVIIFIHKYNQQNNWGEFGVFDTVNKCVSRISLQKCKRKIFDSAFCFIANVTSAHNIIYNGIFGFIRHKPVLILFKQSCIYHQTDFYVNYNDNIVQYELLSKKPIRNIPNTMIYCNRQHSIIGAKNNQLFKMQMPTINLMKRNLPNCKLKKIKANKQIFNSNIHGLHLNYLQSIDKLFGIESIGRVCGDIVVRCGIFAFDTRQWKSIKPYSQKHGRDAHNGCYSTFFDNDTNLIYMIDSAKNTSVFNLNQNKWVTLFRQKKFIKCNDSTKLWIDKNILYLLHYERKGTYERYWGDFDRDIIYYKYCDLRESVPKWKKCLEINTDYFETNYLESWRFELFS